MLYLGVGVPSSPVYASAWRLAAVGVTELRLVAGKDVVAEKSITLILPCIKCIFHKALKFRGISFRTLANY